MAFPQREFRACGGDASGPFLLDGPAALASTEVHASLGNLRTFDEYVADTKREAGYCSDASTRFYSDGAGFSRYEVQQSMFGMFFRR